MNPLLESLKQYHCAACEMAGFIPQKSTSQATIRRFIRGTPRPPPPPAAVTPCFRIEQVGESACFILIELAVTEFPEMMNPQPFSFTPCGLEPPGILGVRGDLEAAAAN